MRNRLRIASIAAIAALFALSGCAFIDRDLRDHRACEGVALVAGPSGVGLLGQIGTPGLAANLANEALPHASARLGRDIHRFTRLHSDLEESAVVPSPAFLRQIQTSAEKVTARCAQVAALGLPPSDQAATTAPSNPTAGQDASDTQQTESDTDQDPSGGGLSGTLASLRIEEERRDGYSRDLFKHWIDDDGNGCSTRDEVLIRESLTPVDVGPGCDISGGLWFSVYDGFQSGDPGDFDIDHVIPLAEAWDSGAWAWSDDERTRFANDLSFRGTLLVVSSSSNRSKSDNDPAGWLPPNEGFHCEYVALWVTIKSRWDLSVDELELAAIEQVQARC